jgi:signal transduction histidine kinase
MNGPNPRFRERYRNALRKYLAAGEDEALLLQAYELGREAVSGEVPLIKVASLHCAALSVLLSEQSDRRMLTSQVCAAGRFFVEALSPFGMLDLRNREANARLREMNTLLEAEAGRIAHALHDQAATLLATVQLDVADMARSPGKPSPEQIARITAHVEELHQQLRRLSHEVRPPILDQYGLVPALQFLGKGIEQRTGLAVTVRGRVSRSLPETVKTTVYRVAQEALTNVARHAQATRATVRIRASRGKLQCRVDDDGRGFDVSAHRENGAKTRGLGLLGMEERIRALEGSIQIESSPGSGTRIDISVPTQAAVRA